MELDSLQTLLTMYGHELCELRGYVLDPVPMILDANTVTIPRILFRASNQLLPEFDRDVWNDWLRVMLHKDLQHLFGVDVALAAASSTVSSAPLFSGAPTLPASMLLERQTCSTTDVHDDVPLGQWYSEEAQAALEIELEALVAAGAEAEAIASSEANVDEAAISPTCPYVPPSEAHL